MTVVSPAQNRECALVSRLVFRENVYHHPHACQSWSLSFDVEKDPAGLAI